MVLIGTNDDFVKVRQATKQGYQEVPFNSIVDLSFPTSKLRRGRYQELNGRNICNTITAAGGALYYIELYDKE